MIACCVTHFIVLFFRHQPAPVSYSTLFSSIRPAQAGMCPKTLLRIASRINRRNNYNVSHFVCSFGGVATFQNSSKQLLQVETTKRRNKTKTPSIIHVRTPLSLYHFMFNKQLLNNQTLKVPLWEFRGLIHRKIICTLIQSRLLFHYLHQHIICQATGTKPKPFVS